MKAPIANGKFYKLAEKSVLLFFDILEVFVNIRIAARMICAWFRSEDVNVEGEGPNRKRVYIFGGVGNEGYFVEYLTAGPAKTIVYE